VTRFQKGQPYSDRLVEKRREAIEEAIKGAASVTVALKRLEKLEKDPRFAAYNVASLNNKGRLILRMRHEP